MKNKCELGQAVCGILEKNYSLVKEEIGQDECLSAAGMVLETECYTVPDFGRLCMLCMQAPGGAMKMETVILVPLYADVPLMNFDRVITPAQQTQIIELYDVQLAAYPSEFLEKYQELKNADSDLTELPDTGEHWYDPILYPCSYHKSGQQITDRIQKTVIDYMTQYAKQLKAAAACDPAEKGQKIRNFAGTLYEKSGPAVEQMKRLFGEEVTKRIVLDYMYGTEVRKGE